MTIQVITRQFNVIDEKGAHNTKDRDTIGDFEYMMSPNNEWFLCVPQTLRRCYFLDPYSKEVLWELMQWMNKDGYCSVAQASLSLYLNISERKIRGIIKELIEKKFIDSRATNSRNIYKIQDLSKNPYIILSESIHYLSQISLRWMTPTSQETRLEREFEYDMVYSKELWKKSVLKFVNTKSMHMPFIKRLSKSYKNLPVVYSENFDELTKYIDNLYRASSS